jgi:transposase-like protein
LIGNRVQLGFRAVEQTGSADLLDPSRCASGSSRRTSTPADDPGLTNEEQAELKRLRKDNFELRRANDILQPQRDREPDLRRSSM